MTFALDPRLANDTIPLGNLALCQVLLMNEQRYPWLILVPQRQNLSDLADLTEADSSTLMMEIRTASSALRAAVNPLKFNVAAIGNRVRQLHIHIIARNEGDAAWPGVVWDKGDAQHYGAADAVERANVIRKAFGAALS
jgi:diadenosine tetraphosphate (Ap4A) HIT family hydrolase